MLIIKFYMKWKCKILVNEEDKAKMCFTGNTLCRVGKNLIFERSQKREGHLGGIWKQVCAVTYVKIEQKPTKLRPALNCHPFNGKMK